jgi:Cytochrome c554 and c-prime
MAPAETSILGKFTPGSNLLRTSNPDLYFRMDERRNDGKGSEFFQTAVLGVPPHTTSRTERIAVVIGSGEKGQTYLYWDEDQLFQLPVSYWADLGWVNSPGYRDGFADFDRPIIPRCLECHATYFKALPPLPNRYSVVGYSLGIQCEVCHGPGRAHVERETSKSVPPSTTAILNPARFSRDRQMDLCAWCHAGPGQSLLPAFSYRPGDPLDKFISFPPPDPDAPPDLHGNQVGMLEKSRCFRSSNMTCLTCHDVHVTQHNLAEFSQRCLSCHKPDSATFSNPDHPVSANCIDCHMPRQQTNLIVFNWNGRRMRPQVRTHWIKIYPENNSP